MGGCWTDGCTLTPPEGIVVEVEGSYEALYRREGGGGK